KETWENAVANVMDSNFDPVRFQDALELDEKSPRRKEAVETLLTLYPNLKIKIQDAVDKYNAWRKNRLYLESPADLMRLLRGAGVMEFRILVRNERGNETKFDRLREQLKEFGPRTREGDTEGWFKIDNPLQFFNLNSQKELETFDYRNKTSEVIERRGSE